MTNAATKDTGRLDRLHWSNQAEHTLRKELNDIALKKCKSLVEDFANCAASAGLKVVWTCRPANNAMNACLHPLTSNKAFEEYKASREKVILNQDI